MNNLEWHAISEMDGYAYTKKGKYAYIKTNTPFIATSNIGKIKYGSIYIAGHKNAMLSIEREYFDLYLLLLQIKSNNETIYAFNRKIHVLLGQIKGNDFKKFKGDFSEMIFMHMYGGIKKSDLSKSADIVIGDKSYEIKTQSPGGYIYVTDTQLESENEIVIVNTFESDDGWTIHQLYEIIAKTHDVSEFNNIYEKYDENLFRDIKLKVKNVLSFEKPVFEKSDFYIEAKFKLSTINATKEFTATTVNHNFPRVKK